MEKNPEMKNLFQLDGRVPVLKASHLACNIF